MLPLELIIIGGFILDILLGDPHGFPHPVRLIGRLALAVEQGTRSLFTNHYFAGVLSVCLILLVSGGVTALLINGANLLHPWLGSIVSVYVVYSCVATKDLARHSRHVYEALQKGDIELARNRVAMIVGRDTSQLDSEGIGRASVESVAENLVDGITAPLFWAAVAGPVGALLYKAINTMDSMFGYKNEKYVEFGWAAAKLDDLANFIPARVTAVLVIITSALVGGEPKNGMSIWLRDRNKTASPNAGQTEAAVAGVLGIQLGGESVYFGEVVAKPELGDAKMPIDAKHIIDTNRLMYISSFFAVLLFTATRYLLY